MLAVTLWLCENVFVAWASLDKNTIPAGLSVTVGAVAQRVVRYLGMTAIRKLDFAGSVLCKNIAEWTPGIDKKGTD
jgi:hypothetical protein